MNFEKYINLYRQHLISEKNLSINTIKSYEIDLKQFFDQSISKKDLNNITAITAAKFLKELSSKLLA